MQGLARASTQGVAAALLGVAVLQALVALTATTPAATAANAVGAAVGVIAFYHYALMSRAPSVGARMELRFSDWAITCPLLLVELSKLTSQGGGSRLAACVALVLGMLWTGWLARRPGGRLSPARFALSCALFVCLILVFVGGVRQHLPLVVAFFAVWALYPIAFWRNDAVMLNVLDLASKAGFGLLVAASSTTR